MTTSQKGLKLMLTGTGQSFFLGLDRRINVGPGSRDDRLDRFYQTSKLAKNHDFQQFRDLASNERFVSPEVVLRCYSDAWGRGNALFDQYILVCDRLDETIFEMSEATKNKKAIITCQDADITSHAMTVARDLGIMCMGFRGGISELEPRFFHQIETGDIIHIKSDGKRGIAYLEKKRERDPYLK